MQKRLNAKKTLGRFLWKDCYEKEINRICASIKFILADSL